MKTMVSLKRIIGHLMMNSLILFNFTMKYLILINIRQQKSMVKSKMYVCSVHLLIQTTVSSVFGIRVSTQIYAFPEDHQYYGYIIHFWRNKEKGGILEELLYRFIKKYKCNKCNKRFTNSKDRDNCGC